MSQADQRFLVRTGAEWILTTASGATPSEIAVPEVLSLVGEPTGQVVDDADLPALDLGERRLAPSWAFVGLLGPDGLVVDDRRGGRTVLDGRDVELIETCELWAAEPDASPPSGPDADARLPRLRECGVLRVVDAPPPPEPAVEPPDTGEPPTGTEEVSGRTLGRRLRSALGVLRGGVRRAGSAPTASDDGRIPVYSVWHEDMGPALSLGMVLAAARAHDGGRLLERFDLRPMETTTSFLQDLRTRSGPAILLCSNYLWSLDNNLAAARAGLGVNPDLLVVHGGPDTPKYEADAEAFLDANAPVARVLVRGEGERTLCELLDALADPDAPDLDDRLADVAGITFRRSDGTVQRTEDRERAADLGAFPSPYLSGEFDHLDADAWPERLAAVETNRGCPYGCTFCDWGAATMSRVRRFEVDRVMAEFRWLQERGLQHVILCDANFGILPQDEEIAARLVDMHEECGFPVGLSILVAKNSTSRVLRVLETLLDGGVPVSTAISLQSTDPATVDAVHRGNISIEVYVQLAAALRRRGHGLQGDLILGPPGQTGDSFRRDLQFMLDHEIMARTWPARLLTNSPMNDPEYRAEHAIESDALGMVMATATLSADDFDEAMRLRLTDIMLERYGLLRHVLRLLQWDHGHPALDVEHQLLRVTRQHPERYPLLSWTLNNFDLYPAVPVGWDSFYDEVLAFVVDEVGVDASSDLRCVIDLQKALMPATGRAFPHRIELEHDYLSYYLGAVRPLYLDGAAGRPERPLASYPPATFTVEGDPMGIGDRGMLWGEASRDEILESDFHLGQATANELDSPLMRILPSTTWLAPRALEDRLRRLGIDPHDRSVPVPPVTDDESVPVTIGSARTGT